MNIAGRKMVLTALCAAVALAALLLPGKAMAQEPFIGEIRIFAGNFAPRGWAFCDGQLMQISSYPALYSLVGTYYGGNGVTTFGLPDLRGRAPIHEGQGAGLTNRILGSRSGTERNTLTTSNLPSHSHAATATVSASTQQGSQASPAGGVPAAGRNFYRPAASANTTMPASVTVGNTGSAASVNNMQPFLTVNYIIALEGIYPPRN